VPVTARLSKLFYERFGDEIVNELVEWFNLLDSTYKSELRQLNELNFGRFDAKLEQRLAELRAELVQRLADFGDRLEKRLETRFEAGFDRLERRLEQQNRLFMLGWITLLAAVVGVSLR
jgi:DNA anti-recombination protein RmuC